MDQVKANIRPLVIWPDSKLRTVCDPVEDFDQTTKQLIADMQQTVRHHDGYGLAAPQVGELIRVITARIPYSDPIGNSEADINSTDNRWSPPPDKLVTMVNPVLEEIDDYYTFKWSEGCLSVPGYFETRGRPQRIVVSYQNENGHNFTKEAQGLAAFIIQHEIDHLNGKVFVDDLSRLKQQRVKKKIAKTLRQQK